MVQSADGEACDDEAGCNNSLCQWYTATCADLNFSVNPGIGVIPYSNSISVTIPTGYTGVSMNWGDGVVVSGLVSGMSHLYSSAGVFNAVAVIQQIGNQSIISCAQTVTGMINGICGNVDGDIIYDFDNAGDSLSGGMSGLCDSGSVAAFAFDTGTHLWSWDCVGSYG